MSNFALAIRTKVIVRNKTSKKTSKMINLNSEFQVARAKRNAAICALYAEVRKANPDATRNRALIAIAKEFNVSTMTVKTVLRAANQYE